MGIRLWTEEEFILTLDLYYRIPFGQITKNNPDIIKMAGLINRTPSSVAMRLCNYANCDPDLKARGVKGLTGGYAQCLPYWERFANKRGDLKAAAIKCRKRLIETAPTDSDEAYTHMSDWDTLVNELYDYKFQNVVKKNYHERCAVSGLTASQFLVACHIVPTTGAEGGIIDASNGILMTLMYARAFTMGLIGFDQNYIIHLSSKLKLHQFDNGYYSIFKKFDGSELGIKDVLIKPNPAYLEWHMDTIFDKDK